MKSAANTLRKQYEPKMDKRLYALLRFAPAVLAGLAVRKPIANRLSQWGFPSGQMPGATVQQQAAEALKRFQRSELLASIGGWTGAGATAAGTQQLLHKYVLPKLDKEISERSSKK